MPTRQMIQLADIRVAVRCRADLDVASAFGLIESIRADIGEALVGYDTDDIQVEVDRSTAIRPAWPCGRLALL